MRNSSFYKNGISAELEQVETSFYDNFASDVIYNAFTDDRTIYIIGVINDAMALVVNRMLDKFIMERSVIPIHIKINSPGGEIIPALSIVSKIETAKDKGIYVITEAEGFVDSGAFFIFIVGNWRTCSRYSRFMLHQPEICDVSFNSTVKMERISKDLSDIWNRIKNIIIENTVITNEMLQEITSNDLDRYFWQEEARQYKIVDEVL